MRGSRSGKWATAPADCLSLIFETGLDCNFPEDDFTTEKIIYGQLYQFISTVSQTCRWWRQVALETPRLWSALTLNDTTPLEVLETWLARSKVAPLSIDFQGDLRSGSPVATSLLPLLVEHIHRWSRFRCISDAVEGVPTFLAAVEGKDAPLLERLSLGPETCLGLLGWTFLVKKIFNGPDSVPKLVGVHLGTAWCNWMPDSPFRNLRSLSLARPQQLGSYLAVELFKNLLLESQQLNRLRLAWDVVCPNQLEAALQRDDQAPQPISLPALNTLAISHHTSPEYLNLILRLIHAPNLRNLRLTDLKSLYWGLAVDFAPTFEFLGAGTFSSFERLEALELRRVRCQSGAAWDLFCAKLTNLRDMNLSYIPAIPVEYEDEFSGYLNSLAFPLGGDVAEGGELRCPNLRTLSVSGWSQHTLMGVVQKRLRLGYGISRVIYGGNNRPDGIIDELAKLGVEGSWCFDRDSEAGSDSE